MHAFLQLISLHPVISTLIGLAVFNALVQAMEEPTEKDGRGYRYVYRASHLIAYNFKYALQKKFPDYVPEDAAPKPKV